MVANMLTGGPYSKNSVRELTDRTMECLSDERIRLYYIRSQVASIDLKVELAIGVAMKTYKQIISTATASAVLPGVASTNRMAAVTTVMGKILGCFGLPTVPASTAMEIVKANVPDDIGNAVMMSLAEGLSAVALISALFTGAPVPLATAPVTIPLAVPATSRLYLMLACDLILILVRSFKEAAERRIGQPQDRELSDAARAYRLLAKDVHAEIANVVRKRNFIASYRVDRIQGRFEEIVTKYREQVEEIESRPQNFRVRPSSDMERSCASDAAASDINDIKTSKLEAEKGVVLSVPVY